MTGAIVNLLDGWTLLAILSGCSLVYVGHLLATNREIRRMSAEIRASYRRIADKRREMGVAPGERLLFDQEETGA